MTWSFRLRFNLVDRAKLSLNEEEWLLDDRPPLRVSLRPASEGTTIADARAFVVTGSGYSAEEGADAAGRSWRGWMTSALASVNVGADFGDRTAPAGGMAAEMRDHLWNATGVRVLQDVHGLSTYENEPPPMFGGLSLAGMASSPHERLAEALERARERDVVLSDEQRLAYDLYSASQSQTDADARLIMLVMATEVLKEQEQRGPDVQELVDTLVGTLSARIEDGSLRSDQSEKDSLLGQLRELRKESNTQAVRRLVAHLGDHPHPYFGEETLDAFIKKCYALRSTLVHGSSPKNRQEVRERAAGLEALVGRLLTLDLREPSAKS